MNEVSLPTGIEQLPLHRRRLEAVCAAASSRDDVLGMVIGGSIASGEADEYSDLDLQLVVEKGGVDTLAAQLRDLAVEAGPVVAAFTAEHVRVPEMLIVLYEDLIHVDLQPVEVGRLPQRNAGLAAFVLWERDGRISGTLPWPAPAPGGPTKDLAWFEGRVWTWSWYIQTKILRGELYEALDGLHYVRDRVLFRLLAFQRGEAGGGSRRIEQHLGPLADRFAATVPAMTQESVLAALREAMRLYVELADPLLAEHGLARNDAARSVVHRALDEGLDWQQPEP
ncbi:MAG TPA: nucleotidyltransferase domain-containing protein [Actinomycetota bacterium]|nr:nucleotidyltransferase domain-containing protein [Actinomycetota bacterium]